MILEFVKGFLTLFLLIKVLLYFVPKNVFEKYISFFAGVLLVIGLLYPLVQVFGVEDVILEKLQYEQWEEQLLELSENAGLMEETGKAYVEQFYGKTVETESAYVVIETIKIGGEIQDGWQNE